MQLGGGIRTLAHIEGWLDKGLARVILGTVAVRDPDLVRQACRLFPGRIAVGIDAKGGKVAVEGWAEASELGVVELAQQFEGAGVAAVIYTDIDRDGVLTGINWELDHRTGRRGLDPGHRLRRPRLDGRHRAHDHARRRTPRRRDLRPRAL